ncbi:MAG: VOC family protein [bacterium]|nr:VOC family protein [bacterium]
MFTKLETPILYTGNIEKAKNFYVEILGFKIISDSGNFVSLGLGDTKIALNFADKPNKFPGHQTIILKSDNIEQDHKILKDRGINIELVLTDLGYGRTFIFRDLDGNKVEVIE